MVAFRDASRSAVALCLLLAAAPSARAQTQEPRHRALDRWRPAPDAGGIAGMTIAPLPVPFAFDLWAALGYAGNLLVVDDRDAGIRGELVGPRMFLHLGGSMTPVDWLQVGINLPVVLYQGRGAAPSPAFGAVGPLEPFGLGDITLLAKAWLLQASRTGVDLALLTSFSIPSHVPRDAYLGDDVIGLSVGVAVSRRLGDLTLGGNFGYAWRDQTRFLDALIGPELRLALGAAYDLQALTDLPLTAGVAWNLAVRQDALFERINESPSELLVEATYAGWAPLVLSAGLGLGLVAGIGTPDVRVLITARWSHGPPDSDGDRIPDPIDQCPQQAEDFDGFQDDDGCPDPDNDGDEIPDARDSCPNQPETRNGYDDEDGCPDEAARLEGDRLSLSGNVHFEVGKAILMKQSRLLLDEAAQVLLDHPELIKVRIEGHTDSDGDDQGNQILSQDRADAVRRYLISKGVDPSRLEAVGYGETRPVASNATERGRAKNRRVEFVVIERR